MKDYKLAELGQNPFTNVKLPVEDLLATVLLLTIYRYRIRACRTGHV